VVGALISAMICVFCAVVAAASPESTQVHEIDHTPGA
jgi:hypothetical protein